MKKMIGQLDRQGRIRTCETYDVDDPDMTAVADLDGQWICFAYESSAPNTPVTVFDILVTNTTDNAADAMWMTIADCDYSASGTPYYLDALRFKLTCDNDALTFSCTSTEAEQPRTCHNIYRGQGYYTAGYVGAVVSQGYTVTVTGGKVTKNGVDTKTGYKADAIEFDYTRTNPDGSTVSPSSLLNPIITSQVGDIRITACYKRS